MKSLPAILICLVCPLVLLAQRDNGIPIAQTMANTYNIYGDKFTGTCFMVSKNGEQYFVTAAHLFATSHRSGEDVSIQLVVQNELQTYHARIYYHTDRKVDIAVLKLSEKISQNVTLPDEFAKYQDTLQKVFHSNGISTDTVWASVGTEVYFLGFPLGNLGTEMFGMKFPLLKKAMISGWVKHNDIDILLLDGHNNLGFSGGPVVAYDETSKQMRIVAVISGYLPEPIGIKTKNETMSIEENSGIIVCYDRRYLEDIFKKNELH